MIRAIQMITKGEQVFVPGEFIDEYYTKDELQELIDAGFAVVKITTKKPEKQDKKVKHAKNS